MESCAPIARPSSPTRPRPDRRGGLATLESLPAPAPAPAALPFAVGLARPAVAARVRAPKGGATIDGHFYRGGSYLPAVAAPAVHREPEPAPAMHGESAPAANPRDGWPDATAEQRWATVGPPATDVDPTEFAVHREPESSAVHRGPEPARFAINGFAYTAREIPAGECGSVAFVLFRGDTNHHYHVLRDNYGLVTCDCPDYLFRCEGTASLCKHGSKLVELGLVPAPTPIASTLGHREFVTPRCSVLCHGPAPRARRFEPSPEDNAVAAELFAEMAGVCC